MPTSTEFTEDEELSKQVEDVISDDRLPLVELRNSDIVIICCMKVRMDDDGETMPPKGFPIKLKKLSDVERLFMKVPAHYVLIADYHWWKHADIRQQTARIFDTLLDIKPENTKTGLKLKKRESGIPVKHPETLALFGPYDEQTIYLRDAVKNSSRRLTEFVSDIKLPDPESSETGENEAGSGEQDVEQESESADSSESTETENAQQETPRKASRQLVKQK